MEESINVLQDVLEAKVCRSVMTNYDGTLDESETYYEGDGMATLDNESKYNGAYRNGLFNGKGSFKWGNGVLYTGDFKNGYIQGVGEYNWPDGSKYIGDIEYYKRQGKGKFTGGSGQVYEGSWKNGLRDGSGTLYYDESHTVSYKGEWQKGLRHGFGTMTYPSGNTYEGEWRENKKCGKGVMLWQDINEIYIGQWDDNLANGEGEHIWMEVPQKTFQRQNCNMYRGAFRDGKRSGHGTFFYANGSQYTGDWLDNVKSGQGCFIHPDGRMHFGKFDNDRMMLLNDESKETEAVTTQYKLNIMELFGVLPAIEKSPSFQQHTLNLERLILRYNSTIRQLIQKYTTAAADLSVIQGNKKRKMHASMEPPASWDKIDNLFSSRRDIHSKFLTIRMQQLCQFARECDIIGPTMTSYDVCMCVKMMHIEHSNAANNEASLFIEKVQDIRQKIKEAEEQAAVELVEAAQTDKSLKSAKSDHSVLPPPAPPIIVDPLHVRVVEGVDLENVPYIIFPSLLDSTFECDIYTDMRFPLRDREFVEAFVRIIAELSSRNHGDSVAGGGLFDNVYRILAETMEPLSTEVRPVSVFVSAFYSEAVQTVLFNSEGSLRSLWDQVLEIAASNGKTNLPCSAPSSRVQSARSTGFSFSESKCRPRVKHVVKLFMALKGTAVAEDGCSVLGILEALNKKGPSGDLSSLDLELCFDDFVELFCRLVVSNLWIYDPEDQTVTEKENMDGAVQKNVPNVSVVEAALVKRLSDWLPLI